MARRNARTLLGSESLESRQVLTGGTTAEAQYMLELINLARTNPAQVAERVTANPDMNLVATVQYYHLDLAAERNAIANLPSRQPMAWDDRLAAAATGHSADMIQGGFQSHTGSDGSSPSQRLDRAGYTDRAVDAENAFAYAESVDRAMQAFLLDWGVPGAPHRNNMLQPNSNSDETWTEVGLGIVKSNRPGMGPLSITQNFARPRDAQPILLGVAFEDRNGDHFYNPGEGRGDVTVSAKLLPDGPTQTVQAWDSGGYQIELAPGDYQVTAKVNGQVIRSQQVNLNDRNVKVDYDLSLPFQAPAPEPEPVRTVVVPEAPVTAPAPEVRMEDTTAMAAVVVTPDVEPVEVVTLAQTSTEAATPTPTESVPTPTVQAPDPVPQTALVPITPATQTAISVMPTGTLNLGTTQGEVRIPAKTSVAQVGANKAKNGGGSLFTNNLITNWLSWSASKARRA